MDEHTATRILIGTAAGGTLVALHGAVVPPEAWATIVGLTAVAWLAAVRRSGPLARPVIPTVGVVECAGRAARSAGDRDRRVFLRETAGSEDDPPVPGCSNGGSPRDAPGRSSAPRPVSDEAAPPVPPSTPETRDAVADEIERLAEGLEDEDSPAEEISFLPPYASDEGTRSAPSEAQRGDAWDPLMEAAERDRDRPPGTDGKMPVPRHFALGTVAVIRKLLEPEEVERILSEQRRYPRLRFGDVAVQLGLLTETQLQELLLAQQEGLFSEAEIEEARDRLRAFRGGGTASPR